MPIKPYIIGIAGGTASGKTTIANKIQEQFKEKVTILSQDFYYKSLDTITLEERKKRNYDCPEAFEMDFMIQQIQELIEGKTIQRPIYSYTERLRIKETVTVEPTPIIVIEGMLVIENENLRNLMDLKLFVNTDSDIRLTRLLQRDVKERGLEVSYIIQKYMDTLKPMHEKYIQPTMEYADIILNGKEIKESTIKFILQAIASYVS